MKYHSYISPVGLLAEGWESFDEMRAFSSDEVGQEKSLNLDPGRYVPEAVSELTDTGLRARYAELHELYRERYGEAEKANPYHDERGRFTSGGDGTGASETQAANEKALDGYLEQVSELIGSRKPKDWKYGSVEGFVLKEGKILSREPFTPDEEQQILRLARGEKWKTKECFMNATKLAMFAEAIGVDARYAEGFGIPSNLKISMPFQHAVVTLNGKPVDFTWQADIQPRTAANYLETAKANLRDSTYRMIEMPTDYVAKTTLARGTYDSSIYALDGKTNLLKSGVPPEWELVKQILTEKANPYHDELGRFAEGDGAGPRQSLVYNEGQKLTAKELLQRPSASISIDTGVRVREALDRAAVIPVDYSITDSGIVRSPIAIQFLQEVRRDRIKGVRDYLNGEILAQYTDGKYGAAITNGGQSVFLKDGQPPVGAGSWMNWPEDHWKLSEKEWNGLSRKQRAELESREQVARWVKSEFDNLLLGTYHPEKEKSEKANPHHDELGRFATGSGGSASATTLRDKIVDFVEAKGVNWLGDGIDLSTPVIGRGVATWRGEIQIDKGYGDLIDKAMRHPGKQLDVAEMEAFHILNHESIHVRGIDRGMKAYQHPDGRGLEEGLTESIARYTDADFVTKLGFKPGPAPQGVYSYTQEVNYVMELAYSAAPKRRKDPIEVLHILEKWKYKTEPEDRLDAIIKDIVSGRGWKDPVSFGLLRHAILETAVPRYNLPKLGNAVAEIGKRNRAGKSQKANPHHDELGRFAEAPGGNGKAAWSDPPKDLGALRQRIAKVAENEGGRWTGSDVVLSSSLEESERLGLRGDVSEQTDWNGRITMNSESSAQIKRAMETGIITRKEADGIINLRHEVIHATGKDRGKEAYGHGWGRALEEGLTEAIAVRTWRSWAERLGFKIDSGEGRRLVYDSEKMYVTNLAKLTVGNDANAIQSKLEEWKYSGSAFYRPRTIASDVVSGSRSGASAEMIEKAIRRGPGNIVAIRDALGRK